MLFLVVAIGAGVYAGKLLADQVTSLGGEIPRDAKIAGAVSVAAAIISIL